MTCQRELLKVPIESAKIDIQQLVNRLKWDVHYTLEQVGKTSQKFTFLIFCPS